MSFNKINRRRRIKFSIRQKISGTADIPRISIFKSNKAFYAQLIDDRKGHTITATSSQEMGKSGVNVERSKQVGKKFGEKAKLVGIKKVVFDRNGYPYHGRVKAFADGAREAGLKF